jgi:Fuc2NAc and GlcNAc transferase
MSGPFLLVLVFAASLLGTGAIRRYAQARRILDVPNERSSHAVPTPRGGGVAIAVAFLMAAALLGISGAIGMPTAVALEGAGILVALIGFVDDHRHVPAAWRLVAHFAAAAWVLAWSGGLVLAQLPGATIGLRVLGDGLAAVALVWLLNLYNFMDGIDGIAAVEAVTVCLGAALLYHLHPGSREEAELPLVLAVAVLGFLFWNFPPAKIFMGDAGSGFVGLMLGGLALRGASIAPSFLWSWVILLAVFIVDATVTLLSRLGRGERVYEAHRSHAYQRLAQRLGSHRPVTLAVGAINLFWLLPLALVVGLGRLSPVTGVVLAYAPLVYGAVHLRAGRRER